eukprot:g33218.t1
MAAAGGLDQDLDIRRSRQYGNSDPNVRIYSSIKSRQPRVSQRVGQSGGDRALGRCCGAVGGDGVLGVKVEWTKVSLQKADKEGEGDMCLALEVVEMTANDPLDVGGVVDGDKGDPIAVVGGKRR